jgi:hypothetical protein
MLLMSLIAKVETSTAFTVRNFQNEEMLLPQIQNQYEHFAHSRIKMAAREGSCVSMHDQSFSA